MPRARSAVPHEQHTCCQVGFAGVACGIARAALDNFMENMRNKVPRGTRVSLRESCVVQSNLAQAEVNLRAARGYVLQSMADTWKNRKAGATITVAQRMNIRIASTLAIHKAREAVDSPTMPPAPTAIFEDHPLERRFRDIHTVTQLCRASSGILKPIGTWMMVAEPDLSFVWVTASTALPIATTLSWPKLSRPKGWHQGQYLDTPLLPHGRYGDQG